MKYKLISVIIPVYNVEKYLVQCLDSVLNQKYKNYEVILINDGSTDSSKKICELYEKKDNRIKLINKKNGGLSSARNLGLDNANGEYITFIDSDDIVDKYFLYDLFNAINNSSCDISICGYQRFTNVVPTLKRNNKIYIENNRSVLEKILYQYKQEVYSVSVCNKMFKKNIFNNIRFPEGRINEDIAIICDLIEKSKNIGIVYNYNYFYRENNNSITTKKFSLKNMDCICFAHQILDRYKNDLKIGLAAKNMYFRRNVEVLSKIYKSNSESMYTNKIKEIITNIKSVRKEIIRDKNAKISSKLTAICSFINIKIAIIMRNFFSK